MNAQEVENIAKVCHEANRAYCQSLGDFSQKSWDECPTWQRDSAMNGVLFHEAHPNAPASASHDNWSLEKIKDGWVYGPEKDPERKQHPCLVDFTELPVEQQLKDYLFKGICKALLLAKN